MSVLAARRSIGDIMYAEEEPDVALIQPPLVKPVFPKDQDPVFNQYPDAATGHAALMNDLGHRAQPQPSPAGRDLADGGREDRRARFPRPGHHAAPGLADHQRDGRAAPGPGSAASISRLGPIPVPASAATPKCGMPAIPHHPPTAEAGRRQRGARQPRRGRGNSPWCQAAVWQQQLQRGQRRQSAVRLVRVCGRDAIEQRHLAGRCITRQSPAPTSSDNS